MPTYSFQNNETQEEWTEVMSIAERDSYLKNNPNITQIITNAPALGDPVRLGLVKPSNDMREQLKRIHKASDKSSQIDTGNLIEV